MRWVAWWWILGCVGCASTLEAGNTYRDLGDHEIATLYYAQHLRENPDDAGARTRLRGSAEDALDALDADFAAAAEAGRHRDALALATRKAELLSFLRTRRLALLDARSARPERKAPGTAPFAQQSGPAL